MSGARNPGRHLWHGLRVRPRLLAAGGAGLLIYAALTSWAPLQGHVEARVLVAWNGAALLYLLLVLHLARGQSPEAMRRHAVTQDEGRFAILLLVVLAAAAVLLAVGSQLLAVRGLHGAAKAWSLALAGFTVLSSWLVTQTLFMLHYAHDFYAARELGETDPLAFPGTHQPGYADFLYFACVIGTSGQTADVSFQGSALRAVGTLHCVLAFFFNATLLALAVNIAAGLLSPVA
jgi:uncharacterized membrane protein